MNVNLPMSCLLTLIEGAARAARELDAQHAIAAATLDINAPKIAQARDNALAHLAGLTAGLHQPPPDPTVNGRLKLTG